MTQQQERVPHVCRDDICPITCVYPVRAFPLRTVPVQPAAAATIVRPLHVIPDTIKPDPAAAAPVRRDNMSAAETVFPARREHIQQAAIRDHASPVQISVSASAVISIPAVLIVPRRELALLIPVRRDITRNAAADVKNVRQAVLHATNITAPHVPAVIRSDQVPIKILLITASVWQIRGPKAILHRDPVQDPTRGPTADLRAADLQRVPADKHTEQT